MALLETAWRRRFHTRVQALETGTPEGPPEGCFSAPAKAKTARHTPYTTRTHPVQTRLRRRIGPRGPRIDRDQAAPPPPVLL